MAMSPEPWRNVTDSARLQVPPSELSEEIFESADSEESILSSGRREVEGGLEGSVFKSVASNSISISDTVSPNTNGWPTTFTSAEEPSDVLI